VLDGDRWKWAWGRAKTEPYKRFGEEIPQITHLGGRETWSILPSPGGSEPITLFSGGGQLPYIALIEWENESGHVFRRKITLQEGSPWLF
jgi:hypothetical protein